MKVKVDRNNEKVEWGQEETNKLESTAELDGEFNTTGLSLLILSAYRPCIPNVVHLSFNKLDIRVYLVNYHSKYEETHDREVRKLGTIVEIIQIIRRHEDSEEQRNRDSNDDDRSEQSRDDGSRRFPPWGTQNGIILTVVLFEGNSRSVLAAQCGVVGQNRGHSRSDGANCN